MMNAEILIELLKIEGAECTICENGERLLNTFEQSAPEEYDMILMDVQMPVMNGYEATKAIRRSTHKLAKTIPIVAMIRKTFSKYRKHLHRQGNALRVLCQIISNFVGWILLYEYIYKIYVSIVYTFRGVLKSA